MNEERALSLPSPEETDSSRPAKRREAILLMEDRDGFMVSVPENRLPAREEAQNYGSLPDRLRRRLIDDIVHRVYHSGN